MVEQVNEEDKESSDHIKDYPLITEVFSVGQGVYEDLFLWGLYSLQNNSKYLYQISMELNLLCSHFENSALVAVYKKIPDHAGTITSSNFALNLKIQAVTQKLILDLGSLVENNYRFIHSTEDDMFFNRIFHAASCHLIKLNILSEDDFIDVETVFGHLQNLSESQMRELIENRRKPKLLNK
jgi:hypothetical protein